MWRFKVDAGEYVAPKGLFLKLARQNSGWTLIDQKFRITRFDDYGRLVSESDQFHQPREKDSGNLVVYLYGADGSLTHIVDPVGRASTVTYRPDGLVQRITDWHAAPRTIDYDYTAATLTKVELVAVANTSGGRPTIGYTYETGSGYKAQLELATNLSTITEPGVATPRVDFTYDASNDRVTSQKWATNETASFTYALPGSATATDVLGQTRTYLFTGANNATDPLADRAHASTITEQVEVWTGAAAGQLPAAITAAAPQVTPTPRTRLFTYLDGVLKNSELVNLRTTELGWSASTGTPGLLLNTQTTSPAGGGGTANSVLPASTPISRTFQYQAGGAFLQSVTAGGKKIDTPEPHRNLKETVAGNDSITNRQIFDQHGQLTSTNATGGLDPNSAGSTSALESWPASAPKHMRGMPRVSHAGSLETTYEYPSETRIVVTDPRKVETTTDFDNWDRPTKVTVTKPGDPLVLTESYTYDASGRVRTVTRGRSSGDVTTTYDYDALGRQTRSSVDQIATVGTLTTTTNYNLSSRTTTTVAPGGSTTTVDLDRLGRVTHSLTTTGNTPLQQHQAYDLGGNPVFSTDLFTASASAFDVHGRPIGTMHADGTITATEYDEWGRATAVKELADDGTQIVGESSLAYTPAGRMTSATTKVDTGIQRSASFAWDGGGRTTGVAVSGRASHSRFDPEGRVVESNAGAGSALVILDSFSHSQPSAFDGWLPQRSVSTDRSGASYTSIAKHDTAGNATETSIGPLSWSQQFDQLGAVTSTTVPSRPATTYTTDSRGAVQTETLPGGAVNAFAYHPNGAQASYTDPASEATATTTDLLGRPTRRDYIADSTFELIEYEGSRVKSVTDRQGRKQTYAYNTKGQLEEIRLDASTVLDRLTYDNAGRMTSWKNADSELTYGDFDLEGRPKTTTQKRFRNSSGLGATPDLIDQYEQKHTYNEHGERTSFTMPRYPGLTFPAGWTASVGLGYDAVGNLITVTRDSAPLMSAIHRGAGRPDSRTVTTSGGATILRTYDYDSTTSQLRRMAVSANGAIVAGSAVTYDGLQLSSAQLLGVSSGQRTMQWRYDVRSRVLASAAGVSATTDPIAPVPGRAQENNTAADFRNEQARVTKFDAATASILSSKGVDTAAIDPPTATFEEQSGHKIAEVVQGSKVRPFAWNGSERLDDGSYTFAYDAKGRVIQATEKPTFGSSRRILYFYSGAGRVIGRRAEYRTTAPPDPPDWRLENRPSILDADRLPAETTFVWDPLSDNLLAVFKAAPTTLDIQAGLLKQLLHGGAAYDDPIETTTTNANDSVTHLYPIFDEAGAGSLQAVLDPGGKLVARMLPNDPFGGANIDFTGPAIDRVAVELRKTSTGQLQEAIVTLHSTERLEVSSLAAGMRLAAVDKDGNLVRSAPGAATLDPDDPFTATWIVPAADWLALTDPAATLVNGVTRTPVSLSVAATNALRSTTWSPNTQILPAPAWAVATRPVFSDRYPVEVRAPLTSLASGSTLYEVKDLSLLGTSGSDTLIEDIAAARFQALPFSEPATGLIYARARWYDPGTGSFLSPDPMGYRGGSSNLYVFGGGDPVNQRDPKGECPDPRCLTGKANALLEKVDEATTPGPTVQLYWREWSKYLGHVGGHAKQQAADAAAGAKRLLMFALAGHQDPELPFEVYEGTKKTIKESYANSKQFYASDSKSEQLAELRPEDWAELNVTIPVLTVDVLSPFAKNAPIRPPKADAPSVRNIGYNRTKKLVHDIGVKYGMRQALADELRPTGWRNPFGNRGSYGQGLDDVYWAPDGSMVIVEYKGGTAGLAPGQMSAVWVQTKIDELINVGDPMGAALQRAFDEGSLSGITYSTPVSKAGVVQPTRVKKVSFY